MKIKNPKMAKEMEQYLFKEGEMDKPLDFDPEDIIKYYPGGPKGPNPEDDPDHYSEWFMRNQPVDEIYGKGADPDFRDIGVKWKYAYGKVKNEDEEMVVERQDDISNFLTADENFPMEGYDGIPEFDVANFDKYKISNGKMPFLRFYSHIQEDELLPLPESHTLDYSKLHD